MVVSMCILSINLNKFGRIEVNFNVVYKVLLRTTDNSSHYDMDGIWSAPTMVREVLVVGAGLFLDCFIKYKRAANVRKKLQHLSLTFEIFINRKKCECGNTCLKSIFKKTKHNRATISNKGVANEVRHT